MLDDQTATPAEASPAHDEAASRHQALNDRAVWLGVLARTGRDVLETHLRSAPALPDFTILRGAESGMAMLRGRIGGGGAAFNLGEITISRCSIRDATGAVGHGYAKGRDLAQVELIARLDAALQNTALRPQLLDRVIAPLAARITARRAATEAQAQETEVKFFTLATMR
jgi:alpha-D-ribose 1-methylphosphonate 5-triphosphate synthase subunit PhnG